MSRIREIRVLLKDAMKSYGQDEPIRLAGTTAFFMMLAIAPIIVIITSLAGSLITDANLESRIINESQSVLGEQGKVFLEKFFKNYSEAGEDKGPQIFGIVFLIGISTTFFSVLQSSINYVWKVKAKPKNNFIKLLQDRLLSFGLILSIGLVLLVTFVVDAGLQILNEYLSQTFPNITTVLFQILSYILSFGVSTVIFALIYKFLPDAKIRWSVTWVGAIVTALLFTLGKYVIGLVLGNSGVADVYGTAGSIVVLMLWLFYSSIIFYFGAEITQQVALRRTDGIRPEKHAVKFEINEIDLEA